VSDIKGENECERGMVKERWDQDERRGTRPAEQISCSRGGTSINASIIEVACYESEVRFRASNSQLTEKS
jgi:hypothetical protein